MARPVVPLDGRTLSCAGVRDLARGAAGATVTRGGRERAAAAARTAAAVMSARAVYGRTTGVGANREQVVAGADLPEHGLRLVRSHAGGSGPLISPELSRAMLAVRTNQIAAGGSGVDPAIFEPLLAAINAGLAAPVPRYGAIGTGDLTALGMTALCLLGERDWLPGGGPQPRFALAPADASAFMSSNAATAGEAALACCDLAELLRAAIVVAALSHRAVAASTEPYAAPVQQARPFRGQQVVASALRGLLAGGPPPARIQDPYGYRAMPQVHGPAMDAVRYAEQTVTVELNAAAENPLVDVAGGTVWHNGNFHTAYLGLALDAVRAALFQTAALSAARLGTLVEPAFTGLPPFLATDRAPSSGVMILEYVAHSAIADIRRLAAPAALGSAVLSRGVEEHAGFSTQSARATTDVAAAYGIVLACELVAAVRALRLAGTQARGTLAGSRAGGTLAGSRAGGTLAGSRAGGTLAEAAGMAAAALPAGTADRALDEDLTIAQDLLPRLAQFAGPLAAGEPSATAARG